VSCHIHFDPLVLLVLLVKMSSDNYFSPSATIINHQYCSASFFRVFPSRQSAVERSEAAL
jgi:hypothetical protein